ncbi:hypothetical protein FHR81_004255 [Actinoalloteichus hoggarensis]|nr:hypothetical protein [Actinoalloteichus hoggarensis]
MSPLPSLTFLHFDAGASPDREGSRAWVPMEKAWQTNDDLLKQTRLVKLAPVREMESWALADLDKVNQLAGCDVRRPDVFESDLLGDVERLTKPKRTLTEALRADSGRRRSRRKASECLPLLAERVRLDRLDRVPSFARWRADTVAALRELSFIR